MQRASVFLRIGTRHPGRSEGSRMRIPRPAVPVYMILYLVHYRKNRYNKSNWNESSLPTDKKGDAAMKIKKIFLPINERIWETSYKISDVCI